MHRRVSFILCNFPFLSSFPLRCHVCSIFNLFQDSRLSYKVNLKCIRDRFNYISKITFNSHTLKNISPVSFAKTVSSVRPRVSQPLKLIHSFIPTTRSRRHHFKDSSSNHYHRFFMCSILLSLNFLPAKTFHLVPKLSSLLFFSFY